MNATPKPPSANTPFLVWPSMVESLSPELRWIVENQHTIIDMLKARPMPKTRPVKVWPDGRVRIEFVGTFESAAQAKIYCANKMFRPKPMKDENT